MNKKENMIFKIICIIIGIIFISIGCANTLLEQDKDWVSEHQEQYEKSIMYEIDRR